jgi:hypothetical protein
MANGSSISGFPFLEVREIKVLKALMSRSLSWPRNSVFASMSPTDLGMKENAMAAIYCKKG